MTDKSRVYACGNRSCASYGVRVSVYGQLHSVRFYSWPTLTCAACGLTPKKIVDPAVPLKK